jgi:hypothetical protein
VDLELLREIFVSKRDEWRKVHNEKLSDLYCSPYVRYSGGQMKKSKIGGACSTHGEDERCKRDFSGKT